MIFGSALLVMAAYSYVAYRLSLTVQPLRLKVAENVEDLIADETIPEHVRNELDRLGDSLLSRTSAWLIVATYPIGVFYALSGREPEAGSIRCHPRHRDIARVYSEGIFCMVANSPICTLLFVIEALLLMLLWLPLGRSARRALHLVFSINGGASPIDRNGAAA